MNNVLSLRNNWCIMKSFLSPPHLLFSFMNLIDYLTTITHIYWVSFFFSVVSHEYLCFSIWSYQCSMEHSREKTKKKWPFPLLIVVVAVEWTFLTLIRGDSSFSFFFFLRCVSTDLFYIFYVRTIHHHQFQTRRNEKIFISVRVLLIV